MPRICQPATRVTAALFALAAAGLCMNGCKTSTPKEPGAAIFAGLDLDVAKLGYRQSWIGVAPTKGGPKLVSFAGDEIAVVDSAGDLSVLSEASGAFRWSADNPDPNPSVRDVRRVGDVIGLCNESEIVVFAADTGDLLARQKLLRIASTAGVGIGRQLFFGTAGGELYAHDAGLGMKLWTYGLGGPVLTNPVMALDRFVCVVSQTGKVFIIDAGSGTSAGVVSISGPSVPSPVAGEQFVFVASDDQSLYAITVAPNVGMKWRLRTEVPLRRQPMYAAGKVYLVIPSKGLHAVNAKTGEIAWRSPSVDADPIALRGSMLLTRSGENLIAVEAETGREIGSVTVPGLVTTTTSTGKDGAVLLGLKDGRIVRLAPK